MENKPLISVLLPVYNCELYIQEAVDSILNQTYTNFELIIVDDCSTDDTVSILKTYSDSRINLIIKPENTGYTNSLNYGISIAKGKYIARMDGDDISLPERFEKQVEFLENNVDYVVCATALNIINSNRTIIYPENHTEIKLDFLKRNCIIHPSVMMKKKILDDFSIKYDSNKEPAEDYDLWVRLLKYGKLHNLQEILILYRIHDNQVSNLKNEQQISISNQIKLDLLNYLDLSSENNLFIKRIINKEDLTFNEIYLFDYLKNQLIKANYNNFFDKKGFEMYLFELENQIINKYFFNRNNYSPKIFIEYIKIKAKTKFQISRMQNFKLLIKSLIFWNVKL